MGRAPAPSPMSQRRQTSSAWCDRDDTYGGLDVAFNNAGIEASPHAVADVTEEEWDRVQAINTKGVLALDEVRDPGHGGAWRRRHRERVVDPRARRRRQRVALQLHQARGRRAHPLGGARLRAGGDPGERDLARHDRDAFDGAHRGQHGGAPRGLPRHAPAGADGAVAGGRRRGALAVLGRGVVRDAAWCCRSTAGTRPNDGAFHARGPGRPARDRAAHVPVRHRHRHRRLRPRRTRSSPRTGRSTTRASAVPAVAGIPRCGSGARSRSRRSRCASTTSPTSSSPTRPTVRPRRRSPTGVRRWGSRVRTVPSTCSNRAGATSTSSCAPTPGGASPRATAQDWMWGTLPPELTGEDAPEPGTR